MAGKRGVSGPRPSDRKATLRDRKSTYRRRAKASILYRASGRPTPGVRMSNSTQPTERRTRPKARAAPWVTHAAIVLAAALATVMFPSAVTEFSQPISLVLWGIVFASAATAMIGFHRSKAREMTAGYAAAVAAAALMLWSTLGNEPRPGVVIKSVGAALFLISAALFVDVRRRLR